MHATLQTRRLTLSPMTAADFDDLVELWSDEVFARAIFPAALSAEEVWMRLLRDIGHWEALGYGNWAVRETSSGAFVGTAGILEFRRTLEAPFVGPELGWGVAPRFQRRGMAMEAVTAALEWSERSLGAVRTVCMIHADNAPSHALAARLGYRPYDRTAYKGGDYLLLERAAGNGAVSGSGTPVGTRPVGA
jgi:RimJ/RimL family protein N-acetyltransferase